MVAAFEVLSSSQPQGRGKGGAREMHGDTRLSCVFLCRAAVLLALVFALAACGGSGGDSGGTGGGGGGGGGTPDTTPPDTSTTISPPPLTNQRNASFGFASTEANSTFEISVDGAAFFSATSPFQLRS